MECLRCSGRKIDITSEGDIIIKNYDSTDKTGRALVEKYISRKPYKITCSKCKAILKKGEK